MLLPQIAALTEMRNVDKVRKSGLKSYCAQLGIGNGHGTCWPENDMRVSSRGNVIHKLAAFFVAAVMLVAMAGCSGQPLSTREKGTLVGGGLGAATGAIIGAAVGAPGVGAAIGGGMGALGGALVGNSMQNQDVQQQQTQGQLQQQQQEIEQQRQQLEQMRQQRETE
jgi:hypothetical protein